MKNYLKIAIVTGLLLSGIAALHFYGAQLGFIGGVADHLVPGIVSSESYLRVIEERENLSDVYDAYFILGRRQDPIAIEFALRDIHSDDDYLWLNAGHYLGILRREESIPYLIKALRHTAWRSDEERVELLQEITERNFGNDFRQWKDWWITEHPESDIDWSSSLGFRPRLDEVACKRAKYFSKIQGTRNKPPVHTEARQAHSLKKKGLADPHLNCSIRCRSSFKCSAIFT